MRKRSAYKPRQIRLDTMHYVLSGFSKMTSNPAAVDLRIKNHSSLKAIIEGRATRDDVDLMIACLNMLEALAKQNKHLGQDWAPEIQDAQEALGTMAKRGILLGDRFIFTGPELNAINLAMQLHDQQIDACNVSQLEAALDLVQRTIRSGNARVIERNFSNELQIM